MRAPSTQTTTSGTRKFSRRWATDSDQRFCTATTHFVGPTSVKGGGKLPQLLDTPLKVPRDQPGTFKCLIEAGRQNVPKRATLLKRAATEIINVPYNVGAITAEVRVSFTRFGSTTVVLLIILSQRTCPFALQLKL